MTNQHIPNDPYEPDRSGLSADNFGRQQRFDTDMQVDPELQEGPASSSRIALFAVGIAIILGAVFYGLNNSNVKEAQTGAPTQTAQQSSPTPSGMRDVTPGPNSQPGMTTGSATNRPTPPQSSPRGTEIDRSANPPANTNDNK
ncbi:MAG: hypothetical protein JOZ74_12380 [Bradyrhizobium sp.]|nr:hypothetical protein [Bradyrhizobium sp.]